MKSQMLIVFIVFVLCSCSKGVQKPDNLISEDTMVDIIYEASILSAAKGVNKKALEDNGIQPEAYLYSKYNVDSAQFANSINYYSKFIDTYDGLYTRIENRISKEKKRIEKVIEADSDKKKERIKELQKNKKTTLLKGVGSVQQDSLKTINPFYKVGIKVEETDITFEDQKVYQLTRASINVPAYVSLKNQKINPGDTVQVSLYVKKVKTTSALGLRVSGVYPNRVDAVFDLNKGLLKGTKSTGYFEQESASIRLMNQDWYECKIKVKANIDQVKVIFGPTDIELGIGSWESKSNTLSYLQTTLPSIDISKKINALQQ